MNRRHLAVAALLPASTLATALPASAQGSNEVVMHAQSVATKTAPGAAPLRALRSSTQKCAGTLVYTQTVSLKGKPVGQLKVYTTAANGGTAIACFHHVGLTKGKRVLTAVTIGGAKVATAKTPAVQVLAHGNFISYAGPAAIGGVKGNCIKAAGAITYLGKAYLVSSPVLCAKK